MNDLARRNADDRHCHSERMVRRRQLRNVAEPANERLRIAGPHANVDAARKMVSVEPAPALRKPSDVRRGPPPTGRRRRVEADFVNDRFGPIDVGPEFPATAERVDDQASSIAGEDELAQMDMPIATARPTDQFAPANRLAGLDQRVDMPVPKVADAREPTDPPRGCLVDASALDRINTMRPPGRRAALRPVIAYGDVDTLVVDRATPSVRPWIEERPADRMLSLKRQHRPSSPRVVVGLKRLESARDTVRHPQDVSRTAAIKPRRSREALRQWPRATVRSVRSPELTTTWSMPAGSLDRWPEDYERGRPGWPPEVVEIPKLAKTANVLDLGPGTGKLTRLLVPRFRRVVAVEPAEAMRRLLSALCPEAEALAGTAQQIPLPDSSVEAVFAAEAFHWFDDERALAEIARVLQPRGSLVLMWNLPAGPWEPSIAAAEDFLMARGPKAGEVAYDPLDLGGPRFVSGEWRLLLDESSFEPLQEARVPNPQTLDREGLVAFFASMGWLADLPDDERLPLLDEVRSLLEPVAYRRLWETHLYWTQVSL